MTYLKNLLLSLVILIAPLHVVAQSSFDQELASILGEEPEFLAVDDAFQFEFHQSDNKVKLVWSIADGYYIYKDKFKFASNQAELGTVQYPVGTWHEDEYFGKTEVYLHQVVLTLPIKQAAAGDLVKIRYQGCADAGLCYPPTTKTIDLAEVSDDGSVIASVVNENSPATSEMADSNDTQPVSTVQDSLADSLKQQSLWINLAAFFILGLGLAFTPCVFPMYPILSGIIVGQGKTLSLARGFTLSMVYVQGMAITYSLLGLVVASAGVKYQAALQHPYILIGISLLFVVLALSMFGVYELRLPSSWQQKFNQMSNNQKGGQLKGVFAMGVISGLVASPCTTAPLSGALLYIAQSGDMLFGGLTLYALSLGMGIPLIVLGTSGGRLLPKAGQWMNMVKVAFGFALLAVPIILLERIISAETASVLWAILGILTAGYFLQANQQTQSPFWQGAVRIVALVILFLAVLTGYQYVNPQSNNTITSNVAASSTNQFIHINTLEELDVELEKASAENRSVMVDLYADWCVACKEFEHYTFPDPAVQAALSNTILIQVNVTDSDDDDIAFLENFDVLGLPTILFFDRNGQELSQRRVTGFMDAEEFTQHIVDTLD